MMEKSRAFKILMDIDKSLLNSGLIVITTDHKLIPEGFTPDVIFNVNQDDLKEIPESIKARAYIFSDEGMNIIESFFKQRTILNAIIKKVIGSPLEKKLRQVVFEQKMYINSSYGLSGTKGSHAELVKPEYTKLILEMLEKSDKKDEIQDEIKQFKELTSIKVVNSGIYGQMSGSFRFFDEELADKITAMGRDVTQGDN